MRKMMIGLMLLLIAPTANAAESVLFTYSLTADEAVPVVQTYNRKNDITYSFATPNANISFVDNQNNSFWYMRASAEIDNDVTLSPEVGWNPFTRPIFQIAESTHISMSIEGHDIGVNFIYQRVNVIPVSWQAIYEVYLDGAIICSVNTQKEGFTPFNSNTWGGSLKFPQPRVSWTWEALNITTIEHNQQPETWNYSTAGHKLRMAFGDNAWGLQQKHCPDPDGTFTERLGDNFGHSLAFDIPTPQSYPQVLIDHKQERLYDHNIQFLAMNRTARTSETVRISEELTGFELGRPECDGFVVFLTCISPVGIIEKIMEWVGSVASLFFAIIPFGETIQRFFAALFRPIADGILLLTVLLFDATHGFGSVYFVLVTWTATWGAVFWAITGQVSAIIVWPWVVTKGITIGTYQLAKFFLWTLPKQAFRWILDLIPG